MKIRRKQETVGHWVDPSKDPEGTNEVGANFKEDTPNLILLVDNKT